MQKLIDQAELFADGNCVSAEYEFFGGAGIPDRTPAGCVKCASKMLGFPPKRLGEGTFWEAINVLDLTMRATGSPEEEANAQATLMKDIFGNPFRSILFNPPWRTSTTVAIAQGLYDSRDFAAMPLLADALEDAGCNHAEILDHCRGTGPHVRGCWVVDLVLGKS